MPFFCKSAKPNKIKKATLQVRIPTNYDTGRKRVSFSASASMTAEAAIVLPLFLFAGVILMMPFKILDVERQMQAIVTSVGEDISQAAYLVQEHSNAAETDMDNLGEVLSGGVANGLFNTAAAYAYAEGAVRMKTGNLPVDFISLTDSALLEDGETVDLVVNYEVRLPFSLFGLDSVKRTSRCYLRAWIGKDGGSGSGNEGNTEDDPIVYIGKNSTRYHISSTCHYLYNRVTAVSLNQIDNYRSESGRRYTACARCVGQTAVSMVYIMPAGEHYHYSTGCSAITAYVSAVRRSTVEYLGACSYCSRGR